MTENIGVRDDDLSGPDSDPDFLTEKVPSSNQPASVQPEAPLSLGRGTNAQEKAPVPPPASGVTAQQFHQKSSLRDFWKIGAASVEPSNLGVLVATSKAKLQARLVYSVTGIVVILFGAVIYAAVRTLNHFVDTKGEVDWHVWLFITTLIIPPTILMLALIRALYADESNSKASALKDLPSMQAGKEVLAFGKDAISAAKEFVK